MSADELYNSAVENYGSSIERLVSAYETNPEKRRDLSQDIHFQLWRSFQRYDARCSLRTWIYRVAHHVATSYVIRERRTSTLVSLEELETLSVEDRSQLAVETRINLSRLSKLIQQLKPLDRQVIVCWLEGIDATSIGEITGLAAGSVAMRIHRIKNILARQFNRGSSYAEYFDEDARAVWQGQPTDVSKITSLLIEQRARQLRAQTRRNTLGTLITPCLVALLYVFCSRVFPKQHEALNPLFAAALAWSLIGLYLLNRGQQPGAIPEDAAFSTGLEFCRQELSRQSYHLRRVLLWSLGPMVLALGTRILTFALVAGRPLLLRAIPVMTLAVL